MNKYIFTKSMKRSERSDLSRKLYSESHSNQKVIKIFNDLVKLVKDKKKKALFGSKSNEPIYAIKTFNYKGIEVYMIVNSTELSDVIFNTSPIDASYSEFIRVIPNGTTVLYTQHLLDRYNERVHYRKYTNHKDMIKRFIVNNAVKSAIVSDKDGSNNVVQRIDEGFIMGVFEGKNFIMNTFYDSEQHKDSDIKNRGRIFHAKTTQLSDEELKKFYLLQEKFENGKMSFEDFDYQVKLNNYR